MTATQITGPLAHAQRYLEHGFSVIPIRADGSKRPKTAWEAWQEKRPTPQTVTRWFADGNAGIGVVCGKVSGGLEVVDVDDGDEFPAVLAYLLLSGLEKKVSVVQSPRKGGGYHIWYRCEKVGPNTKIASDEEGKCLIETRGEGGYVLAVGSPPGSMRHSTWRINILMIKRLDPTREESTISLTTWNHFGPCSSLRYSSRIIPP